MFEHLFKTSSHPPAPSLRTAPANRWGKSKEILSVRDPYGKQALTRSSLAIAHHCFHKPAPGLTNQTCGTPHRVNTI
jgi:hypothetical protein